LRASLKGKGRQLTRDDWIEAAIGQMTLTSVEQTRVETLARDLGVSKGSFYWHFKTRDELLACVLERWKQSSTLDVQSELDSVLDPVSRLLLYMLVPLSSRRAQKTAELEHVIIGWARHSVIARRALVDVERGRVLHLAGIFVEIGCRQPEAYASAHAAYAFLTYVCRRRDVSVNSRREMSAFVRDLLVNAARPKRRPPPAIRAPK
jgi:AcrR family transcriptional regulator